jgi:hypothetical protein
MARSDVAFKQAGWGSFSGYEPSGESSAASRRALSVPRFRDLRVELMKLGAHELFGRQHRLVFSDKRGRHRSRKRVLDDFIVFGGAEQNANCRALM